MIINNNGVTAETFFFRFSSLRVFSPFLLQFVFRWKIGETKKKKKKKKKRKKGKTNKQTNKSQELFPPTTPFALLWKNIKKLKKLKKLKK